MVNWTTPLAAALTFWLVLAFWLMREMYLEGVETELRQRLAVKFCGSGGGEVRVDGPRAGDGTGEGVGPTTVIVCRQPQGSAR
jgi:hypothetical protein